MAATFQYRTLLGRKIDLDSLSSKERASLRDILRIYQNRPDWNDFAERWTRYVNECGLNFDSPVYRICDDLESRLGIEQGYVAPPDYRDVLAALIEERYGSRYKFCQEVGVDQAQLSRVLAGESHFSFDRLREILQKLGARLIIQPEESVKATASAEEAGALLARLA